MISFGHGVVLTPLKRSHIKQYMASRNDFDIWRWCRQNDLLNEVGHERWFERQALDPAISMYEIKERHDSPCLGVCGLTDIDHQNKRAEFSVYVDRGYAGNKYGEKALKTLLDHGFKNLGLNIIWGESIIPNPAIKTFMSLGFLEEGIRRDFYWKDGEYRDARIFSMKANEWLKS